MALRNRGLTTEESLATQITSITASGLEAVLTAPLYLYSVVLAEGTLAAPIVVKLANATASGTRASLMLAAVSGTAGNGGHPGTTQVVFNPPVHFDAGLFVSSTGTNLGVVSFVYKS